jgi:RNA polymerase sigma factor for flagellar operon FliA
MASFDGSDADGMASFEDRRRPSPLGRAELNDLRRWVTEGFSRRDRLIIVLYYYEQLTKREIGNTLGCIWTRSKKVRKATFNTVAG